MNKLELNIESTKRVFAVGDIHGEITMLNDKLAEIGFDKESDILISVGDLIDRGEDSLACLALIQEPWFKSVRGNHEDLMIQSIIGKDERYLSCWIHNGGNWYFDLNQEDRMYADDLAKLANDELPHVMEINYKGKKFVVCHADYPGDEYTGEIKDEMLFDSIWSRKRIEEFKKEGKSVPIKGADMFIFGHTPIRKPLHVDNCMWIDTGAVFGKELTIIELS